MDRWRWDTNHCRSNLHHYRRYHESQYRPLPFQAVQRARIQNHSVSLHIPDANFQNQSPANVF